MKYNFKKLSRLFQYFNYTPKRVAIFANYYSIFHSTSKYTVTLTTKTQN